MLISKTNNDEGQCNSVASQWKKNYRTEIRLQTTWLFVSLFILVYLFFVWCAISCGCLMFETYLMIIYFSELYVLVFFWISLSLYWTTMLRFTPMVLSADGWARSCIENCFDNVEGKKMNNFNYLCIMWQGASLLQDVAQYTLFSE